MDLKLREKTDLRTFTSGFWRRKLKLKMIKLQEDGKELQP
jgi:hypothetical protein